MTVNQRVGSAPSKLTVSASSSATATWSLVRTTTRSRTRLSVRRRYTVSLGFCEPFGTPVESESVSSVSSYSSNSVLGPISTRRSPLFFTTITAYPGHTRIAGAPAYLVLSVSVRGSV